MHLSLAIKCLPGTFNAKLLGRLPEPHRIRDHGRSRITLHLVGAASSRKKNMNTVTLKKNGAIVYNGERVTSDAINLLSSQITLDENYTLRSFFEMLEKYTLFAKLNAFLPTYREQFHACPEYGCDAGILDYLEFGKTVEMIGVPDKRLEIYNSLFGCHAGETSEIRSMQLAHLLDLPLKLGKLKHIVFGDRVDLFEFDTVYTLFEFIDGIAWELSFHVTPEQCELRR